MAKEDSTPIPLTKKDIANLLSGKAFERLLVKSSRYTARTGQTSGFYATRDILGQCHFSKVDTEGYASNSLSIKVNDEMGKYPLMHLQFCTNNGYISPPGRGDLLAYTLLKNQGAYQSRPINILAQVDDLGNGELVLLQEKDVETLSAADLSIICQKTRHLIQGEHSAEEIAKA